MTVYLDVEDLVALVARLGCRPVRDIGLLGSSAHRPQVTIYGNEAYPTPALKAAAPLHSLVQNRALVDGNERLGWLACVVFADLNGERPDLSLDQAFALVMAVARGALDVPEIALRLRLQPR